MHQIEKAAFPLNGKLRRPERKSIVAGSRLAGTGPTKPLASPSAARHSQATGGVRPPLSAAADAEAFLLDLAGEKRDRTDPLGWFKNVTSVIRRTSRSRHVRAVASAHALALRLDVDPERDLVLRELERLVDRKITGRTRDLHLLIEHVVGYGADTPAELAAARRLVSRDLRAIEFLRAAKIRPSEVEALARKKGEGLDQWSRRAAKPRPLKKTSVQEALLSPRQEQQERSLSHVVFHIVRDDAGAEVERDKIVVAGALLDEVKGALDRVRKLGA